VVDRRHGARTVSEPLPSGGGIDVDRLMDDLKRRVAARRAAGEIDPRVLDLPFSPLDDASAAAPIRLRPEVAYSSKPGVGRAITFVKRAMIRMQFHFLNDAVTQANAALARLDEQLREERQARAGLARTVARLEGELAGLRRAADDREPPADPSA
jgi:hypothetical protein